MLVEPAANHLAVFRPLVVGVERGVNAYKALAVILDERHHVLLLAVVQVKLAGGAHKNQHVKIIQILRVSFEVLLGDQFGVGAQRRIPETALVAHVVDGGHSVRNRIVLEPLGLSNHQDVFEMNFLSVRRGGKRKIRGRLILSA